MGRTRGGDENFLAETSPSSRHGTFRYFFSFLGRTAGTRSAVKQDTDRITRVHLIPRASMFAQARVKREHVNRGRNRIGLQTAEALLFP